MSELEPPASRLRLLQPNELSPEQRALHDELAGGRRATGPFTIVDGGGRLYGPFNAFLYSPSIGNALQELGQSLRFGGDLTDRVREMIILLVGGTKGSDYEVYAHTRVGRRSGIIETEIDVLVDGRIPATVTEAERSLLELVTVAIECNDVDEELWSAAVTGSDEKIVVEALAVAGYYLTLAMMLNATATQAPRE